MTMVFSRQLVVKMWQGNYKLFKKKVRIRLSVESKRPALLVFNRNNSVIRRVR